jgi:acetylornithine/succinyldiaminopimelate/putrescine aminotransferase
MLRTSFFKHVAQTSPEPMAIEISHAYGNYLFDTKGNKYLDLIAGISVSNVGHRNPDVVTAIKNQADQHLHTLVYGEHIQQPQVLLAEALANSLPAPLTQICFVNSGSEAIEGAMKLVKRVTGRFEILGCNNAYHGSSQGALSLNGDEYYKRNFRPLLPGIRQIRFGNFDDLKRINVKTAGVFVETVQGEAGVRTAESSYFKALRHKCTETGTMLVLDEIQTGFGRTGTFWGFTQHDIVPDIIVMAKGMGGGMPIGAFAASEQHLLQFTFDPVLGHISTFGGHPVSCAASLATMRFIENNHLVEQVKEKETLFRNHLTHDSILEIRSAGLLMAVELGSFDKVLQTIRHCLEMGVITDWFLHCNTALRIAPPLTIRPEEIRSACEVITAALNK